MKKKRTKKFNPNKLLPSQVKQLQQEAQYKKDISETYEMSMEFISSHVRDFIEDKKIGEKSTPGNGIQKHDSPCRMDMKHDKKRFQK